MESDVRVCRLTDSIHSICWLCGAIWAAGQQHRMSAPACRQDAHITRRRWQSGQCAQDCRLTGPVLQHCWLYRDSCIDVHQGGRSRTAGSVRAQRGRLTLRAERAHGVVGVALICDRNYPATSGQSAEGLRAQGCAHTSSSAPTQGHRSLSVSRHLPAGGLGGVSTSQPLHPRLSHNQQSWRAHRVSQPA